MFGSGCPFRLVCCGQAILSAGFACRLRGAMQRQESGKARAGVDMFALAFGPAPLCRSVGRGESNVPFGGDNTTGGSGENAPMLRDKVASQRFAGVQSLRNQCSA